MSPISPQARWAVTAVLDVALHGRVDPVPSRDIAERHRLGPRQLEAVLRSLVGARILLGFRGPRGGYRLARERRRISVGDVVRAVDTSEPQDEGSTNPVGSVLKDALARAGAAFVAALDGVTIADLCRQAGEAAPEESNFTI